MSVWDHNGTTFSEIGKIYDGDNTTLHQIAKGWDNNGTINSLVYGGSLGDFLYQNGQFNTSDVPGLDIDPFNNNGSIQKLNDQLYLYFETGNGAWREGYIRFNKPLDFSGYDGITFDILYSANESSAGDYANFQIKLNDTIIFAGVNVPTGSKYYKLPDRIYSGQRSTRTIMFSDYGLSNSDLQALTLSFVISMYAPPGAYGNIGIIRLYSVKLI